MKSSGNYSLTGTLQDDEFYGDGDEEETYGRSSDSKKMLVVVALKMVECDDISRAMDSSSVMHGNFSFRPFFERYIRHEAIVVKDEWNEYKPLMDKYTIEQ